MTRQSSSPSEPGEAGKEQTGASLFGPMFTTPELSASTGRDAWVQAMLDVEAALALAQADAGLVPREAAQTIAECCRVELFDTASIGRRAAASATPVIALVGDLGELVGPEAARHLHHGATSQDIVDTAAMLVTRRALDLLLADLHAVAEHCADLAERHRGTLMTARSLLQHALPTTFGRKCAGWLVAVSEATDGLRRLRRERLAVQFGGPAGTLASLHGEGHQVASLLARRLELAEPVLPWHTDRNRIGELAAALGTVAGTLGKLALDVKLQAQTEIGELVEGRSGGSSAMPHKRNPVRAVRVTAAAERVPGLVAGLLAAMPQEHERAAGAWQAEWEPLSELLCLVGGASSAMRELLAELQVDPERMRANLDRTAGLLMAEHAASALTAHLGRGRARELVTEVCRRVVAGGTSLRAELLDDASVRAVLGEQEIVAATEPGDYLGSVGTFVDRALRAHARTKEV